jgi:hypothetical protein
MVLSSSTTSSLTMARLAPLTLHYLTLGTPRHNANGAIAKRVLLLHGAAGSAADPVKTVAATP